MLRWDLLALAFGYNELAKQVQTLGQKTMCRLCRESALDAYRKAGGTLTFEYDPPVLTLTDSIAPIVFTAADIEQMREAVRQYDALQSTETGR